MYRRIDVPRPTKFRRVEFFPEDTYFVPYNKPKCEIEEVNLKIEELEAMRLKDIEGLNQEECAEKMHNGYRKSLMLTYLRPLKSEAWIFRNMIL